MSLYIFEPVTSAMYIELVFEFTFLNGKIQYSITAHLLPNTSRSLLIDLFHHINAAPTAAATPAKHHILGPFHPAPISNPLAVPALAVAAADVAVAVAVAEPVLLAPIKASHVLKFYPPRNFPTVYASLRWMLCSSAAPSVAFVAQKSTVKLKVLTIPPQISTTVIPSYSP